MLTVAGQGASLLRGVGKIWVVASVAAVSWFGERWRGGCGERMLAQCVSVDSG